jgi:hypothetical protein
VSVELRLFIQEMDIKSLTVNDISLKFTIRSTDQEITGQLDDDFILDAQEKILDAIQNPYIGY